MFGVCDAGMSGVGLQAFCPGAMQEDQALAAHTQVTTTWLVLYLNLIKVDFPVFFSSKFGA